MTTASAPIAAEAEAERAARRRRFAEIVLPPVLAILVSAVVGDVIILAFGQSPASVYRLLLDGTWGNGYGIGQVLYKATTLTFTGLSVAYALRAGLFNVGGEGQLAAGGFAAALAGMLLPAGVPWIIAVPVLMLAAALAGGVVGAVPGVLRAKFGAHEVITTIMLNFVVLAVLNYFLESHFKVPDTLHTPEIHAGAVSRLSDFLPALHGSAANLTILIAIADAAFVWWYLFRTRRGYELRATGLQPAAAEYGGVHTGRVWIAALTRAGAIAGLGGVNFVAGYKHYYEDGFASGAGFLGIAVAIVGGSHPAGVVLAALFFATLSQGGLAVNAVVPKQMADALQAVAIIAMAASVPEARRLLRTAGKVFARATADTARE